MSETLCVIPDCYLRGRHTNDCTTDCTGCLPGLAADTLRICRWHHDRAKQHLADLPGLDRDLGIALATRTTMIRAYTTGTTHWSNAANKWTEPLIGWAVIVIYVDDDEYGTDIQAFVMDEGVPTTVAEYLRSRSEGVQLDRIDLT